MKKGFSQPEMRIADIDRVVKAGRLFALPFVLIYFGNPGTELGVLLVMARPVCASLHLDLSQLSVSEGGPVLICLGHKIRSSGVFSDSRVSRTRTPM
jgi:hypothetical protein